MKKRSKAPLFKPNKKTRLAVLAALILIVLGLELTNTTHLFHKAKPISGTIPATNPPSAAQKSQPKNNSTVNDTGGSSASSSQKTGAVASGVSGTLLSPYGTFISNHHPGTNNSPLDETSVCNTSPGATCYIKFVQGNVVKTLPVHTTDASGAAYWSWNVGQAGLTSGVWQITAIASLNDQTKTSADPLNLEIQ